MSDKATLNLNGKAFELPVITGTENEKAIDISEMRSQSEYITLDLGFKNTGSTLSAITFLDGEKGVLRYRGFPIEQLAEESSFLEVAYLLIYGELPTQPELDYFDQSIRKHTLVHEDMKKFFDGYPSKSHPMGMLASMVCSLSAFYPESLDPGRGPDALNLSIVRVLAKMPTLAARTYKKQIGHPIVYPTNGLDYVSNFMKMTFGHVTEDYVVDPVVIDTMNKLLILHADHEQNCSTSTVRLVGSSQANIYASIAAGIAALWGPLHGGANQAVIEMLEQIRADGGGTKKWVDKAKDKNDPFRLMGFGHRVYKNYDPRARIIKEAADKVLSRMGINDPILDIAKQLEETALRDEYFIERKLYPNVDFYSGIIYRAIGFPTNMFTVLFALGRLPGWIAQWKEMLEHKHPIGRPRQVYTGPTERDYVPMARR
jgi:citrate synthase